MFELVKGLFKRNNELAIQNIKHRGNNIATISFNESSGEVAVVINHKLKLKIEGDFEFDAKDTDVVTGNMNIDTWHSKFNLNSRKSKQIRNLPEAIAYREEANKLIEKHKFWVNHHKEIVKRIDKVVKDYEDEQLEIENKKIKYEDK